MSDCIEMNTGEVGFVSFAVMSSIRVIAIYRDGGLGGNCNGVVIDVAPDGTVTLGAEFTMNTMNVFTNVTALSSTRAIAIYVDT